MDVTQGEHPNVTLVRQSFVRTKAGDFAGAMADWAPGARYHAFDADGIESRDIETPDELMRTGQRLLEHHENEIVEIRAVGDEIVLLQLRVIATSRAGQSMTAEYLIVLNVRGGKIRWACDFIDSAIQTFLDEAWS